MSVQIMEDKSTSDQESIVHEDVFERWKLQIVISNPSIKMG